MINIAICEDDIEQLSALVSLVEEYKKDFHRDIQYTAFQGAVDLIEIMEKGKRFDVMFLDIVMPFLNGMDAAKEIRKKDTNVKIIFLTSSTEFAVESYAVGAYYYALKPVWRDKLFTLLDKVLEDIEKPENDCLMVKSKGEVIRILLSRLVYCEVIGKNIFFHLSENRVIESTGTFSSISAALMRYPNFLKPHRSYLVNMEHIDSISSKEITMNGLKKIPIARGYSGFVKETYLSFCFDR